MIQLEKLNKSYRVGKGRLHVLKDIDLEIGAGELVSVMGSSGSGKSTLLNILGILDDYDSGSYQLANNLIRRLSERKAADYRNRFIGFVFQSFNLISFKTAVENVALPLFYQKVSRRRRNGIARKESDRRHDRWKRIGSSAAYQARTRPFSCLRPRRINGLC